MVLVLHGGGTKPFSRLRSERESRRDPQTPPGCDPSDQKADHKAPPLKGSIIFSRQPSHKVLGHSRSNYCFSLRGQSKSDRCHFHPALEFSLSWSFLAACIDKDAEIETSDIQ